jgi:ADP-ribose pyrophosphatase YjhB (NUDIX family)
MDSAQQREHPRHIVAVSGLVTGDDGRVLLVKTLSRGWEPPGGQVELGEDLVTALQREIAEESGCTVDVDRLVGVYSNTAPPEKVIFMFRCAWTGGAPRPSEETPEVGWFAPMEAVGLVTHPAEAARLRDALRHEAGVVYGVYRTRPYIAVSERKF